MLKNFYRGDSKSWPVRLYSALYIGGTCWFTLKSSPDDTDIDAVVQKSAAFSADPDDATVALAVITLAAADTDGLLGKYYYDFQAVSAGGDVATPLSGTVTVLKDVTRSIA